MSNAPQSIKMYIVMITVTELTKWAMIVLVVYLSVWQYGEVAGYTEFFSSASSLEAQYFGLISIIIIAISLLLYLPWRILAIRYRNKFKLLRDNRWRQAIVGYILLCSIPCLTMILVAYKSEILVLGVVITEWMVKIQQEKFSFELLTAMMFDFFFAYDVIALLMMSTDPDVYQSGWVYACFVFGVIAMVKYVPTQPLSMTERQSSIGHVVCILTSMFCNDIPFVTIRLSTMIIYGFIISDIIYLLKNFFIIFFNCIQLGVIWYNIKKSAVSGVEVAAAAAAATAAIAAADAEVTEKPHVRQYSDVGDGAVDGRKMFADILEGIIRERRAFRGPDVWNDPFEEPVVADNRISQDDGRRSSSLDHRSSQMTIDDLESSDNNAFAHDNADHLE